MTLRAIAPHQYPVVPLKSMDVAMLQFELVNRMTPMTIDERLMVTSAVQISAHVHRGQFRKERTPGELAPYAEHPLRVALRLMRWGLTSPYGIVAALFHDAVEDQAPRIVFEHARHMAAEPLSAVETTRLALGWISKHYSVMTAECVSGVTNDPAGHQTYQTKIEQIATSEGSIHTVVEALSILIKASDLVDNAGSLKHQVDVLGVKRVLRLIGKYESSLLTIATACESLMNTETLPEMEGRLPQDITQAASAARDRLIEAHQDLVGLAETLS